MIKCIKFKAL